MKISALNLSFTVWRQSYLDSTSFPFVRYYMDESAVIYVCTRTSAQINS